MKKGFVLALIFGMFFVSIAIAGPANIAGDWSGMGQGILTDGTICIIDMTGAVSQNGTLLWGTFTFSTDNPTDCGGGTVGFTGNISAGNQIKAIMSAPGYGGIGVMDAKLMGKTISGVALDFSDGSTTIFNVTPGD